MVGEPIKMKSRDEILKKLSEVNGFNWEADYWIGYINALEWVIE